MAIDSDLVFLDGSADITASKTDAAGLDFGGPDLVPVTYMVVVEGTSGTSPTLDIKIQESDNNSTWRDHLVFAQITTKGVFYATGKSDARYRRYYTTTGGEDPTFEKVLVAPVQAGRYDNF